MSDGKHCKLTYLAVYSDNVYLFSQFGLFIVHKMVEYGVLIVTDFVLN